MPSLIINFPSDNVAPLRWWIIDNGKIINQGVDYARECMEQKFDFDQVAAIVSTQRIIIQYHQFENMTYKQAQTAAKLEAQYKLIDSNQQFIVTQQDNFLSRDHENSDKQFITSVSMTKDDLQNGLQKCAELNLDPDIVTSAALLVERPQDEGQIIYGSVGNDAILWMYDNICIDEESLRSLFVTDQKITELSSDDIDAAIVRIFDTPLPNMRQGIYAKPNQFFKFNKSQSKNIWLLLGLLTITTMLIYLATYMRYSWDIDNMENRSLSLAGKAGVSDTNIVTVKEAIDKKLAEQGGDIRGSISLSAALFDAMEAIPDANIDNLSYNGDGLLKATIASPKREDINAVLIAIQRAGYKVTATPRDNSAGFAVADITVTIS